jgi:hypothetical protein
MSSGFWDDGRLTSHGRRDSAGIDGRIVSRLRRSEAGGEKRNSDRGFDEHLDRICACMDGFGDPIDAVCET